MAEKYRYDILVKNLKFNDVRNKIFDDLNCKINTFISQNDDYKDLKDFLSKFEEYKNNYPDITLYGFKFDIRGNIINFYHKDFKDFTYSISYVKKFQISLNSDGSEAKDEWIFNDDFLMYLINNVYNMKNPKFAHRIESIQEESSIISLNENNLEEYIEKDWNFIYEAKESINFDKILGIKKKDFIEKENEEFFKDLIGSKQIGNLSKDYHKYKTYCSSLDKIFLKRNLANKRTIIFHNEDIYFRYNLLSELERTYAAREFGNFYINFELLRDIKRHERLERIAYFLSFLFPKDYEKFRNFFEENIKYKISDDLNCWKEIIIEIIDYFEKNIFKKEKEKLNEGDNNKKSNDNNNNKTLNENIQLFGDVNDKKFIIVFDNILTKEENEIIESIINDYNKDNFIFFTIYPLMNEFTENKFIEYINEPYDTHSPFSLFFANIIDFEKKSPKYEEKTDIKIFKDVKQNDEMIIYDLVRIFNFKSIFVDSINRDINSKSLEFLVKYMKYLNIKFDNTGKKIINIAFKNKFIENQFKTKYDDILTMIKTKNNLSFNNLIGQRDGFDLEKIMINEIIYSQKKEFGTLEVKSIFGLKQIEKEEKIDYQNSNFFIKQKSPTGEMFDFAFKIIQDKKQYLKIAQMTSKKTKDEKEKLSIEIMKINCSYLKKKFKENKLGDINGVSFCIISPIRILDDKYIDDYISLKEFCEENNYEFILFDINESLFYKRENEENIKIDIFDINIKYQLDIIDFDEIIKIDKPLKIKSLRKVKGRNKDNEDSMVQTALKLTKENVKRIAKFEYTGVFNDLKKLKENYFAYIYFQEQSYIYFYNNKIINKFGEQNIGTKKLILILYFVKPITNEYLDSTKIMKIDNDDKEKIPKNMENINMNKNKIEEKTELNEIKHELEIDEEKERTKTIGDKSPNKFKIYKESEKKSHKKTKNPENKFLGKKTK